MVLLKEDGKHHRTCCATATSLAIMSQLAGAPDTAAAGVQGAGEKGKGCHCCHKQESEPPALEHSVVIDIPAPHGEHQEDEIPDAKMKGKISGRGCGAGKACDSSKVPAASCAPQEGDQEYMRVSVLMKTASCDKVRSKCGSPKEGCRVARCCSGSKDGIPDPPALAFVQ